MTVDQGIELVRILIWPAVLVFFLLRLRNHLPDLLSGLTDFEGYGIKAKFARAVHEVAAESSATTTAEAVAPIAPAATRSEILEAWIQLESALFELGALQNIPFFRGDIARVMRELNMKEIVRGEDVRLVQQLRQLRNAAAHEASLTISPATAAEYVQVASKLTAQVRDVIEGRRRTTYGPSA